MGVTQTFLFTGKIEDVAGAKNQALTTLQAILAEEARR
ncbi:MAG: hypothetical protein ACI81P_002606 [Neolewinella sp.]|jgi:hypothetical protein